jgi:hypothetical protein
MGKGIRIAGLWPKRSSDSQPKAESGPEPALSTINVEGIDYVFGLDWRMVPPTRRLTRALSLARDEGQAWYAATELEDVIGYLKSPKWLRGPHYSASLHLAGRHSQGGLELFALVFDDGRHGVLALQDSRPLPGFDYLGRAEVARTMVEDFLAIQRGQPIRLIGNTSFLEGQETVAPGDLFIEPRKETRLRSLRSWRPARKVILLVLVSLGLAAGAHYWLDKQREETQALLQNSPVHQQKLYRESLTKAWSAIPPKANALLHAWHETVSPMPMHWRGWKLSRVECRIDQCLAYWQRGHGSYSSFMARLPANAQAVDEAASNQDLTAGTIATRHALRPLEPTEPERLEDLPGQLFVRRGLMDLLQDLQLLGQGFFQIAPASLFGGQQNPELLNEAVVHGRWTLRHALWIWPELRLPHYTRVHSLSLHFQRPAAGKDKKESQSQDPDWTEPFFELSGDYYAQK